MRIRPVLAEVAAATALALAGIAAPSAYAATPPDATYWTQEFMNQGAGVCLDDSGGLGLRAISCNADSMKNGYQTWWFTDTGGSFQFSDVKTGRCLDGSAGAGVRTYTCSDASYTNGYQKWVEYTYSSDGNWVAWKNVATGKCLDFSSGAGLRLYTCNTASFANGYQKWFY